MNQRDQKLTNRMEILHLLRSSPGISQAEIAVRTHLQPSTTSNLVRGLRGLGLVARVGKGDSGPQGGKKADILALRAEYGYFGGIYLKEDEIIFGVVDFRGNIVARKRLSVGGDQASGIVAAIVAEIEDNGRRFPPYLGTGIAVSSVVDSEGRIEESLHFTRAMPQVISEIRRGVPGLPVIVDNDANCAADWDLMATADGLRNLVHLQVQTSPITVGAGIIIDGVVYRGSAGAAGEILQAHGLGLGAALVDDLARLIRFVSAFLDTQAVFVAGELDGNAISALKDRTAVFNDSSEIHILDNPDLPVLGASLQAIRLRIRQIIRED